MQMIDINLMLADILGAKGLVGVNPEIAVDALRKTAIDFTVQSGVWEYYGQFTSQENVADYPIDVPADSRVASMRWLSIDGQMVGANPRVQNVPWLQSRNPDSFFSTYGFGFTMEGREFVWLSPTPETSTSLIKFCAALKPTQTACTLPNILYEDWNDAMTAGTAYRLFLLPKQEWTNNALGMLNQKEYSRWIARARLTKAQNYSQAPMVLSGSYF